MHASKKGSSRRKDVFIFMTVEKLKSILESGAITKEEYDELIGKLSLVENQEKSNEQEQQEKRSKDAENDKRIEKLIQSAIDRTAQKWGEKYKELERKHKKLQEEKLTAEELKTAQIEEKEKEIAQREKTLLDRENRLYCIKAIKKVGLDSGGDEALDLIDFIIAEDKEEIDVKIKTFKTLFDKFVKNEVEKTFKSSGRNPEKANANTTENPYMKETFNLTKQLELEQNNPELAETLRKASQFSLRKEN